MSVIVTHSRERGYPGLFCGTPHLDWYQWVTRMIAEDLQRPCKVLDAGCGAGYGARELWRMGHDVTAFDVSAEALDYADESQRHAAYIDRWMQVGEDAWECHFCSSSDATLKPWAFHVSCPMDDLTAAVVERGPFDVIVSIDSLEHVEDDAKALRELRRVATDEARLYISTPDRAMAEKHKLSVSEHHHREYEDAELGRLLTANGWHPECDADGAMCVHVVESHPFHMGVIARAQ